MKAANSGATLFGSKHTQGEILDKDQIKCDLAAQTLRSSGTLRLRAFGFSMLPSLWPGDVLTIRSQRFEQWRPGDIALYMRAGHFFVHRVITVSESGDSLILQGDWLRQPDPPVRSQQVLGKVVAVERSGVHYQPKLQPSIRCRTFARALGSCGFLLRVVMAIRTHRHSRKAMHPAQAWRLMRWA
jgi:hypothetical protein